MNNSNGEQQLSGRLEVADLVAHDDAVRLELLPERHGHRVLQLGAAHLENAAKFLALVGERRGKQYRLGDRVRIIVLKASLEERKIDFRLVEDKTKDSGLPPPAPRGQPAKRKKQKY